MFKKTNWFCILTACAICFFGGLYLLGLLPAPPEAEPISFSLHQIPLWVWAFLALIVLGGLGRLAYLYRIELLRVVLYAVMLVTFLSGSYTGYLAGGFKGAVIGAVVTAIAQMFLLGWLGTRHAEE